ncbi:PAS domain-containing sensor histidine kinase [Chryseobacterium sp. HSC-36S06]|uniref:PAS domain-containing sensor histidine kinase n=1 Tax=Chryseobacterium sp. HSC-36S06 TaxID=2910970 RepID=UPI00209FF6F7|nr:PAS domain-containing sensor histidine kinase [Chryseobacterium sp. HSC-36S06]MCP2038706.1 PAS domain S-box-containing protein [Chryseobacterium sp. HSC-36S06]
MKNFLLNNVSLDSLTTLFSQAPVALAMLMGKDQVVEIANRQILDLWGKDESVIGLPLLQALPEIKDQEFPNILKGVYNTGITYKGNSVLAMIEKNGILNECYFDFVYSPIFNNNTINGVSVVATEVTEKVLSEKKLKESEIRFKELMEISDYSTGIYVGEDLIIDFANDQMIKTWGKDKSVIGKPLEEALPELKGQPFIGILQNIFKTGVPYVAQEDKVDLVVDGVLQTYYYNFSYKPLRDVSGNIYAIMNVAMNVTELVEARKRAEASEVEYRNLAEAMPQMVWTAGIDGAIDFCNNNMMDLLGCSEQTIGQLNFKEIVHPVDYMKLVDAWIKAAEKNTYFEMEFRLKDIRTSEYRWFLSRATPVLDKDKFVKWIGTCTDINEFKNLVSQKDTFLGIASHELKTPLTSLKLYAQVLERMLKKTGDEKNAQFAKKMDLQVIKLTSLIGDLLDVTKINSGKIHLNQDVFDFEQLVVETVEEMQMSTMHKIEIVTEHVGTVFADRERISQVITNLISNAIKYSPEAERIVINVKGDGKNTVFTVQDFGIGMPEENKDRVFEQYYRVSGDEQSTFPGLGLGLYIAAQIVERSHGKIWVNSVLGKGSTFSFSLPVVKI